METKNEESENHLSPRQISFNLWEGNEGKFGQLPSDHYAPAPGYRSASIIYLCSLTV